MMFNNARVFRFTKPVSIDPEQLEAALLQSPFNPCGPQELSRSGWVSPLGKKGEHLTYFAGGCLLICLQHQEKILPASVIKEIVEERCEEIEAEQVRKVRRKEKDEIKDQVTLDLLPRAFHRTKKTYAYLSTTDGYMVVNTSSAKVAEDCASALRKAIGSLPVRPLVVNQSPSFTFTGWLSESIEIPGAIKLGNDCLLEDPSEDGGKLTAKGLDLESDELRNYIASGMHVTRISVEFDENLSFVLDSDLTISKLQFGDSFQEKLNDVDADDAMARFDAAFCLMTQELRRFLPQCLDAFGGEDRDAIVEGEPVVLADPASLPRASEEHNSNYTADVLERDSLYSEAELFVIAEQRVTISSIQRKFKVGYNRAAHLVEELCARSVVSGEGPDGGRRVLLLNVAS